MAVKVALAPNKDEYFRPLKPQLSLSSYRIRSRPADAAATEQQADKFAQEAGARLTPVLLDAQRTTLAGVRLVDWRGIVTGGREDVGKSLAHISEVQQALQGHYAQRDPPAHDSTVAAAVGIDQPRHRRARVRRLPDISRRPIVRRGAFVAHAEQHSRTSVRARRKKLLLAAAIVLLLGPCPGCNHILRNRPAVAWIDRTKPNGSPAATRKRWSRWPTQ